MKRLIALLVLLLLASPATAIERSPDNRGHIDRDGRAQASSDRDRDLSGKREGGRAGDREGSKGRNGGQVLRDHSGQRGDRN
jgi:hypothetical protein